VRDLFTTRVRLGVTTASHVDMVLGEGARERGALADEIPGDARHAGIGFTIDPITRLPVRFRAAFCTDADIDELVATCSPHPRPRDVIELPGGRKGRSGDDGWVA
jgi:DNA segregation ATPase FtsK/SpoIIIE, S-DNA-T family